MSSKNWKVIGLILVFLIICSPAAAEAATKVTINGEVVASAIADGKVKTISTDEKLKSSLASTDGPKISTSIINGVLTEEIISKTIMKKGETYTYILNTATASPTDWKIENSKGLKLDKTSTQDIKKFVATDTGEQFIIAKYQSTNLKETIKIIIDVV